VKGMSNEKYTDFSNVEVGRSYIPAQQTPEGPYGSPYKANEPLQGKEELTGATELRSYSAFNYENKTLHEGLPRQMDGAHPTHDDPTRDTQIPYKKNQTMDEK
jgi:hypothetical protein